MKIMVPTVNVGTIPSYDDYMRIPAVVTGVCGGCGLPGRVVAVVVTSR